MKELYNKHKYSILKPKYMNSTDAQTSTSPAIVGNNVLPAVLFDVNERYYFKTRGQEPDVECTERCMFKDNGICIGSAACQECEHHFENNVDEWGCISWIKCRKINEAVSKNGR